MSGPRCNRCDYAWDDCECDADAGPDAVSRPAADLGPAIDLAVEAARTEFKIRPSHDWARFVGPDGEVARRESVAGIRACIAAVRILRREQDQGSK